MFPRHIETVLKIVVLYSVAMLVIEIDITGAANSHEAPAFFLWSERLVALLLTVEMFFRFRSQEGPGLGGKLRNYLSSPFGLIDLLAVLPFWIGFAVPVEALSVIRTLRVFRLTKFYRYSPTAQSIGRSLWQARAKIRVVGMLVLLTLLFGSLVMYEVEHAAQPEAFGSVMNSLWWSVVTVTTVGYGDIAPVTPLGKLIASLLMPFVLAVMGAFIGIVGGAFQDAGES